MILLTYGTRPEYIKIKPIIDELRKHNTPFKVLFTGQHETLVNGYYDIKLNLEEFNHENRLDNIIANLMTLKSDIFEDVTSVLVQGDTTSVVGMSIAAMHRKIPIIHLEAGLRTHDTDNPYPEEFNRKIVSSIAHVHLCPTYDAAKNLKDENILKNVFVVGNTVLDNLIQHKNDCEETNKILVTLHRRENHEMIDEWFTMINSLAKETNFEFILPIHPNPNVLAKKDLLTHVNVVEPLSHEDLIKILVKTKMVITDSGGLQEECSFFDKQCLVCRKYTERPEALGFTSHLVRTPRMLRNEFYRQLSGTNQSQKCPYGDGQSSEKICKVLKDLNLI
jgi:UDP-N-acetylglucosamine 2-epimerase (non-hydrolysing)